jgi:hypothetical protein
MSNIMQATHHQDGDNKDALHACEKHKGWHHFSF